MILLLIVLVGLDFAWLQQSIDTGIKLCQDIELCSHICKWKTVKVQMLIEWHP